MDNQQPSRIEWRTVIEYDRYEVNQFGDIRHKERKRVLTQRPNNGGYLYVNFNIEGHRKNFAVHRIVANAFIPNPNNYPEVNHKDGDRTNNNVTNLEWVSSSQNKIHAYQKEENRASRGKQVEQYSLQGILLRTFISASEAARFIGCSVGAISNCCKGRTKTSQGYVWKYAEGSTTKYSRKPSESVRSSSIKEDEDIVSTSSES